MNPIHLIWIIPFSALFGYVVGALLVTAKAYDKQMDGDFPK